MIKVHFKILSMMNSFLINDWGSFKNFLNDEFNFLNEIEVHFQLLSMIYG